MYVSSFTCSDSDERPLTIVTLQGVISYRALWYVFTKGKKVIGKTDTNYSVGAGASRLSCPFSMRSIKQ